MIDLVPVKKDMLRFVQEVRAVRGMGQGIGMLIHQLGLYGDPLCIPKVGYKPTTQPTFIVKNKKPNHHKGEKIYLFTAYNL